MRSAHVFAPWRVGMLVGLALVGAAPAWAGTCALCREALASGGSPGVIRGIYYSIILIIGVAATLMGVIGRLLWRLWRAERALPPAQRP